MDYVTLGSTNITVNKNGFGALPIQRVSEKEAVYLLRKAYDNGITFFDTARFYSDSEKKIGMALSGMRDKIFIATKTGSKDAKTFWEHLHTSLELLKTDYIDVYQYHNAPEFPKPGDESGIYEAMLEAKAQGKIRHIGISCHMLTVAVDAANSGLYETVQFPISYLASKTELDFIRLCKNKNIGVIGMKGMSGGLITNSRAAYAFSLQFDNLLPIWGVQRENELDEFISYQENPPELDAALLAEIEKDRAELSGSFCRGCGYCLPCPQNIEIPTSARMIQLIRRAPSAGYLSPEWVEKMSRIETCIHCNHCVSHCPYGLDTPTLLNENWLDYQTFIKK